MMVRLHLPTKCLFTVAALVVLLLSGCGRGGMAGDRGVGKSDADLLAFANEASAEQQDLRENAKEEKVAQTAQNQWHKELLMVPRQPLTAPDPDPRIDEPDDSSSGEK